MERACCCCCGVWGETPLVYLGSQSKSSPNAPGLPPLIAASMAEESRRIASIFSWPIPSLVMLGSPSRSTRDTPKARWRAPSLSLPRNESIERRSGFKSGCSDRTSRTPTDVAGKGRA